jgi:hypothetical protein
VNKEYPKFFVVVDYVAALTWKGRKTALPLD